jgi:hypothetical protein
VSEQGADNAEVHASWRGALPGDRARLRGLPLFVEGGMGGTILGTQPELRAVTSDDRRTL